MSTDPDHAEYDHEAAQREAEERWRAKMLAIAPKLTAERYEALCKRRFGDANPTRFDNPLWEWLVRTWMRTPYAARELYGLEYHDGGMGGQDPDWCFARFGRAEVTLSDGRSVSIGGEHEDSYDPDFCIYNDVIVRDRRDGRDEVTIYGYPPEVFPPTDSASATLMGEHIVVIGSIGYLGQRGGPTPVYVLDTRTFEMRRLPTSGEDPGWIFGHSAALSDDGSAIEIDGGERIDGLPYPCAPEPPHSSWFNLDAYRLDVAADASYGVWARTRDASAWRQFHIKYEDLMMLGFDAIDEQLAIYDGTAFKNLGYPFAPYDDPFDGDGPDGWEEPEDPNWCEPDRVHVLTVDGVRVELRDQHGGLWVVVRGELPKTVVNTLLVDIAEAVHATGRTVESVAERRP